MANGDEAAALSGRVPSLLPRMRVEAGSNLALVLPFLSDVLGYDWRDPRDIEPEFRVGPGPGDRVDFAVIPSVPFMVVECKFVGAPIGAVAVGQLAGYYREFGAVFGALTNGLVWRFYGGFGGGGEMNTLPFFEVDIECLSAADLEGLAALSKGAGVGAAVCWAARRWLALESGGCGGEGSREGVERAALAVVREALRGAGAVGRVALEVYTDDSNIFYYRAGGSRLRSVGWNFGAAAVGLGFTLAAVMGLRLGAWHLWRGCAGVLARLCGGSRAML